MKHKFFYLLGLLALSCFLEIPVFAWQLNLEFERIPTKDAVGCRVGDIPVVTFYGTVDERSKGLEDRIHFFRRGIEVLWNNPVTTQDISYLSFFKNDAEWTEVRLWDHPWFWLSSIESAAFHLAPLEASQFLVCQLQFLASQNRVVLGPLGEKSTSVFSSQLVKVSQSPTIDNSGRLLHPMICGRVPVGSRVRLKNLQNGYSVVCNTVALGPLDGSIVASIDPRTWAFLGLTTDKKNANLEFSPFAPEDMPL